MLILALVLLVIASLLILLAHGQERKSGLPSGHLVYVDHQDWQPVDEVFFDPKLGLSGKPDYLVKQHGRLIPIEVKSSTPPDQPYDSHVYQLAAYCSLVHHHYHQRPVYGLLLYTLRQALQTSARINAFSIDFTPALETQLIKLLAEMHSKQGELNLARSHHQPARCISCGYRAICDQRLA